MIRANLAVAASFLAFAAACRAPALPHTVAFRVVDERGAPLSAARAQLREATCEGAEPASAFDELSAWCSPWCVANSRGRVLVPVPDARDARRLVEVRARGFAPRWVWVAESDLGRPVPRGVVELGDVALERGGRIRGYVHREGVAARYGWRVRVRGAVLRDGADVFYTAGASTFTELGRFELVDVPAGEVELEAVRTNGVYLRGPFVTVEPGMTVQASIAVPESLDVDRVARMMRASVSVRLNGTPPPDLELRLRDHSGKVTGQILAQADGTLGPLGAEPGTYTCVFASQTSGWSVTQPDALQLGAAEVRWLEFDATTTRGTLTLVRVDNGAPVASERFAIRALELRGADRDPTWLRTDADGRATVALPPGAYALTSITDSSSSTPALLAVFEWPPRGEPSHMFVRVR